MSISSAISAALHGLKTHQPLAASFSVILCAPALAHGEGTAWGAIVAILGGILLFGLTGLAALVAKLAPRGKKVLGACLFFFGIVLTYYPVKGLTLRALAFFRGNDLAGNAFGPVSIAFFVAWVVFIGWLVRSWRRAKRIADLA